MIIRFRVVSLVVGLVFISSAATAQPRNQEQLLKSLQQQQTEAPEREQEFRANPDKRADLLAAEKQKTAELQARATALEAEVQTSKVELQLKRERLGERSESLKAMFAAVNLSAGELYANARKSIISTQLPARLPEIQALATRSEQPDIDSLRTLWLRQLEEMTEAGRVTEYQAEITDARGESSEETVIRIGSFGAVTEEGNYLRYVPPGGSKAGELQVMGASNSPPLMDRWRGWWQATMPDFMEGWVNDPAEPGRLIDPTQGELLLARAESPTVLERVKQGGLVGYVILFLGLIGLIIAVYRLAYLAYTGIGISLQLRNDEPNPRNPLGRVLLAWREVQNDAGDVPVETLELKIDEAILPEIPRLERGQNTLKLLAAVAPLLGLLGTVTGMIATFQSITTFGTSDPKLMAGGISQALMTTVLGLVVAIPLLFAHAIVASRSRSQVQVLDEQSAGLIAHRVELANAPVATQTPAEKLQVANKAAEDKVAENKARSEQAQAERVAAQQAADNTASPAEKPPVSTDELPGA